MTRSNDDDTRQSPDDDLEYLPPFSIPAEAADASPLQRADTIGADKKMYARQRIDYQQYKRRQLRTSVILFVLTLCSTFLVASDYVPIRWTLAVILNDAKNYEEGRILDQSLNFNRPPVSIEQAFRDKLLNGLMYSFPLMLILFSHEMGH